MQLTITVGRFFRYCLHTLHHHIIQQVTYPFLFVDFTYPLLYAKFTYPLLFATFTYPLLFATFTYPLLFVELRYLVLLVEFIFAARLAVWELLPFGVGVICNQSRLLFQTRQLDCGTPLSINTSLFRWQWRRCTLNFIFLPMGPFIV